MFLQYYETEKVNNGNLCSKCAIGIFVGRVADCSQERKANDAYEQYKSNQVQFRTSFTQIYMFDC